MRWCELVLEYSGVDVDTLDEYRQLKTACLLLLLYPLLPDFPLKCGNKYTFVFWCESVTKESVIAEISNVDVIVKIHLQPRYSKIRYGNSLWLFHSM